VRPFRHSLVARALLASVALGSPASRTVAVEAAPAVTATEEDVPAAPAAAPGEGSRRTTRTVKVDLPLEVEVHGRFLMGLSADERDGWGRELGMSSARIDLEARLPGVKTVLEADLTSDTLVEDAYIRLDGPAATRLTAGRFKAPFSERRLESEWRLPLVDRGLVDDVVVKRGGLGGRRLGAAGTLRPWNGRLEATAGIFTGSPDSLDAGTESGEDFAARVSARPWDALELGASGYRAGRDASAATGPTRQAAAAHVALHLGPFEAALEGFAGRVALGPFTAGTALLGWTFRGGEGGRLRVMPIAGAEVLEVRGATRGVGHSAIAGAVLSWTEGLKVKLQGEWARRPGDDEAATWLAAELGTAF
jgi:hypothetical protein